MFTFESLNFFNAPFRDKFLSASLKTKNQLKMHHRSPQSLCRNFIAAQGDRRHRAAFFARGEHQRTQTDVRKRSCIHRGAGCVGSVCGPRLHGHRAQPP